jgi:hypothetical protein
MRSLLFLALGVVTAARSVAGVVTTAEILENPSSKVTPCYGFTEDRMKLVVAQDGAALDSFEFCSSYGKASVTVETDRSGRAFVLLRYGEGRGTNARSEYIMIFAASTPLIELARLPVSAPAGPFSQWHYDVTVQPRRSHGLRITMTLRVDGRVEGKDREFIPSEKSRTYEIE